MWAVVMVPAPRRVKASSSRRGGWSSGRGSEEVRSVCRAVGCEVPGVTVVLPSEGTEREASRVSSILRLMSLRMLKRRVPGGWKNETIDSGIIFRRG